MHILRREPLALVERGEEASAEYGSERRTESRFFASRLRRERPIKRRSFMGNSMRKMRRRIFKPEVVTRLLTSSVRILRAEDFLFFLEERVLWTL